MISTHCNFGSQMTAYKSQVYRDLARLMSDAGLTPNLQFGEFLWWFFTNYSTFNPGGGMAFYDPETRADAMTALGRELHLFRTPDDNPDVNGGADALFLRNRLRDHVNSLRAAVLAEHPNAKFELLWPYDVNHPTPAGVHQLGGRLNRFVNLPAEWEQKEGSGLDRIKMEALDFSMWSRDSNLIHKSIEFPLDLGWPKDSVRYLVAIFRGAYTWEREFWYARNLGIPVVNMWAFDHVCIFGLPVPEREYRPRTAQQGRR